MAIENVRAGGKSSEGRGSDSTEKETRSGHQKDMSAVWKEVPEVRLEPRAPTPVPLCCTCLAAADRQFLPAS